MEFILIICGVILMMTAISQVFWDDEVKWVDLILRFLLATINILFGVSVVVLTYIVGLFILLVSKKPPDHE